MEEEVKQALKNLVDINNILESMGIIYTLDGGTLLGAARQRDFCKDDHKDIDLTIPYDEDVYKQDSQRDIAMKILEEANKIGFTLYHYWRKKRKTTAQISLLRNDIKVDIMFKERKGKKAWWTVCGGGRKPTYKAVYSKHFFCGVEDYQIVEIRGERFLAPAEAAEYLTTRYGDWMTPVHASEYSYYQHDKSIVKNYDKI